MASEPITPSTEKFPCMKYCNMQRNFFQEQIFGKEFFIMSEIVTIENTEMQIREYNGQRVVTFKDIDKVHQRKDGTARWTFNRNKKHFVLGEDYFVCKTHEAKNMFGITAPNGLTLLSEQGYLMLVKPFSDDLSWQVQRQLVNNYFKKQESTVEQQAPQLTAEEVIDWKLNDLHKRLKALEAKHADKPRIQKLNRLTPRKNTWYEKNRNRIWRIRYDKDMELKELYHLILEECGKYYDLDEAERLYRDREGCAPAYSIDLVEYFPELQDIANQVLDYFEK